MTSGAKIFVHRNAVLPEFMTWLNQVGTYLLCLKFPGTKARFTATKTNGSLILKGIDHKTFWQSPTL